MNTVKITIGNKEIEFAFGLGFLGAALEDMDLGVDEVQGKIQKNPFKIVPLLMYHSAKYAQERVGKEPQYSLIDRDLLRDPVSGNPLVVDGTTSEALNEGRFEGQFLLAYEPSHGTIFYIGYSLIRQGHNTYDLSSMELMSDGLFVKLSYLFRL